MANVLRAEVRNGRIELLEPAPLPEGTQVLVTLLADDDEFWSGASENSLKEVWDNPEDDVYGKLLEE